ncbi:MAG: hypothetical protein EXS32_14260 [Opitutus sp.]|nr:hypothetical protein [Opitutus sp.]
MIRGHWHLGLFGFYDRQEGKHDDGLAISVRGLLLWLLTGTVVAYLAAATALFWFWQRNPYCLLTYSDAVLYPLRRGEVLAKKGQAFIAQGTDSLRAKKWWEGQALLRQGLVLYPHDLHARLMLGQFYVAANQRPLALKVLQEGLRKEFPGRAYLQVLFDIAEQGEDYDLVVQIGDRFLPQLTGDATARNRRWLVARQFSALLADRHFNEALAVATAEEPGETASEHRVLALLGRGRTAEALGQLAEWQARPRADVRAVVRLRVRALREAEQPEAMEQAIEELRALSPADPRVAVYGVVQRAMAGRDEAAQAALTDYLFRFGGAAQNLQLVAEPLAEIGDRGLLERCVAAATERGYALRPFQLLLVKTQVKRGDWAAANRTLAVIKPPTGREAMQEQLWHDWMRRLIDAAQGQSEAAPVTLLEFLRSRPWSIKLYHQSIEALRLAGRVEPARAVIALAGRAFPGSAWLEAQKTEVANEIIAHRPALAAAVTSNQPPEKVFFQRLDEFIRFEQWAAVDQLIREARTAQPAPPWLDPRDGELRFAQMRSAHAKGERPEMLAATRLYLNGSTERSQQTLGLGRTLFAQGDTNTAIALAKEVLRQTPDFPPAQRLLREWQPKPVRK